MSAFRARMGIGYWGLPFAALAFVALALAPNPGLAEASKKAVSKKTIVPIPFEVERAAERGDRARVNLNDDATIVPAHRIRKLPIVDGRMGEHIQLDGVTIYMPFGRVISATADFRPDRINQGQSEPDPNYARVAKFDSALGPVCASEGKADSEVQMRINRYNAMSLVQVTGAPSPQPAYRVETSLETKYFRDPGLAGRLAKSCSGFRSAAAKN